MRPTLLLLLLASAAACRTSNLGACSADSDCSSSGVCDPARRVCVEPESPRVVVTSPAADAVVDGASLQVSATAHAAGGVSAVAFELRSPAGALLASADGAPEGDAGWTASLAVGLIPAGPAAVTATATHPHGSTPSPAVGVSIVDRDAPRIEVTYAPPGIPDGSGHLLFGSAPATITATITDRSGVDPNSVCLRLPGETGACQHTATAGPNHTWFFSLPHPPGPQDGTAPFAFTVEADDTLAASLTGADQQQHQTRSPQTVYFDYAPPSVSISADTTPYARTAVPIPVSALVTDPAGVPDGGVLLNGAQATSRDGGLFVFQLDPRGATAGVEGPYAFQISASDGLGNSGQQGGTRLVDDAPPAASNVRVFKGTDPGTPGVTYPAAVAGTGWTGSSFIYSDTVHVAGTLTDLSGIGSAGLHVDGIDINGAPSVGSQTPLGCPAAATTCNFDVQVQLNVAQPEFHTASSVIDGGVAGLQIPSGLLDLTIESADAAKSADGVPAPHPAAPTTTTARATRLLWQQAISVGNVTGMAVHPDGDLIVTGDSNTGNSLYALSTTQRGIRWRTGGTAMTSPDAGVLDAPAIGTGDATSAPIYVANAIGNLYSFAPDGGVSWAALTSAGSPTSNNVNAFAVAPAVYNGAWTDGGVSEAVIEPDNDLGTENVWVASGATGNVTTASLMANVDSTSAPMIFGNYVWFGTFSGIERHALNGTASPGPAESVAAAKVRPHYGIVTDGTSLFAATVRSASRTTDLDLYAFDPAANPATVAMRWDATTAHLFAEPTLGIDGQLYASSFDHNEYTVKPNNPGGGTLTTLFSAGNTANGWTPLQGSDGNWYLSSTAGTVGAYQGKRLSWLFNPPGTVLGSATMDCQGRLFVASGNTVYALISDDKGLGDSPWPSRRRDARNTGNANAPRYGMRLGDGSCTQ